MRRVDSDRLRRPAAPILEARLSPDRLHELFPLEMVEFDPLAAAEPSEGALVELRDGTCVVVTYGRHTHTLVLESPPDRARKTIASILHEVPFEKKELLWSFGKAGARETTPRARRKVMVGRDPRTGQVQVGRDATRLMGINGVGIKYVQLLLASGVRSANDLSKQTPSDLSVKLRAANVRRQISRTEPSESQLADWIRQAKHISKKSGANARQVTARREQG